MQELLLNIAWITARSLKNDLKRRDHLKMEVIHTVVGWYYNLDPERILTRPFKIQQALLCNILPFIKQIEPSSHNLGPRLIRPEEFEETIVWADIPCRRSGICWHVVNRLLNIRGDTLFWKRVAKRLAPKRE